MSSPGYKSYEDFLMDRYDEDSALIHINLSTEGGGDLQEKGSYSE